MSELPERYKTCRDCGDVKPFSEFWAWKSSPDGRALYCKICFGLRNSAAAERRATREGRTRRPRGPRRDVPEGHKFCPGCTTVLPLEDFVRNRTTKSGYGGYCRPCQNAKSAASLKKNHGTTRHYHLTRRYGVGADHVEQLLHAQEWRCPICSTELTLKTAHVDHDHVTGAVRGILCFNCNGGLGQFHDDVARLRRAADYLERRKPLVYVIPATDRRVEFPLLGVYPHRQESTLEQRLVQALADASPGTTP